MADFLLAGLLAYFSISNPPSASRFSGSATVAVFYGIAAVCCAAIVLRRLHPVASVCAIGAALVGHLVVSDEVSLLSIVSCMIAAETTQSRVRRPWSLVLLALVYVGVVPAAYHAGGLIDPRVAGGLVDRILIPNVTGWALVSVAALVGASRRRARERVEQALERAVILQAQQDTERRLAVAQERQRIARDVHDLLGHSLSVIGMQAAGARAVLASDPDAADTALAVIGETSRRAVDEVRALVDILRSEAAGSEASEGVAAASAVGAGGTGAGAGPADETAEAVDAGTGTFAGTGPAASSHDHERDLLREPVHQAQHAGLPVTLETDPTERLPPAAAQVFHRVAQESLTNVLRHAPGATTTVSLSTGIGRAVLAVENAPAPKARAASSAQAADAPEGSEGDGENGPVHRGFGLIGMRDRVAELGGSFTAGPTPEGGWRVMAELPVVPE